MCDANEALLAKAAKGDKAAQDALVFQNMGLVHSMVRRFVGRGVETEDLVQIGCIGLIKAIARFDPSFDVKFSTYAVPMILGEIKRFLRDDGAVKVSRSVKELAMKASFLRQELSAQKGEEPGLSELADRLGTTASELAVAMEATGRPESLQAVHDDGSKEGIPLLDKLTDHKDHATEVTDHVTLRQLIAKLPPREQKLLALRYYKQRTQADVGRMLGISQVQVSRIEKKLLSTLREEMLSEQ